MFLVILECLNYSQDFMLLERGNPYVRVWSLYQQTQHHLEAYLKCKFSAPLQILWRIWGWSLAVSSFFFAFFFIFIFLLYNIVLVLPYISMNLPQAYTCSPSWTLLPPPSPYHPSGSSQCTRTWKQPRYPSADEWIRKLWYIYTMEYYAAIKKNTFESVLTRWMKLEPVIQSEVCFLGSTVSHCSITQSCPTLCHSMDCPHQASLSITNSWSLLKLMSTVLVIPSNHLILCSSLLLPSAFPSTMVFSKELVLRIWWPKYWHFSLSISPFNEYSGLISFRIDWFNLLSVQGTLQHHSSKASILQCSAFFMVQLSHPCMTTAKTIALTRWTFVGKVMSLLFNMLSRLVGHSFSSKEQVF